MNSGSSITFGCTENEMDSSLCLDKDGDEGDNFDAFNDETFGNDVFDGDWEQEHEKLASILERRNDNRETICLNTTPNKNYADDTSNNQTIADIERCLSMLHFDEQASKANEMDLKKGLLSFDSTANHMKHDNKIDEISQRALYQNLSSIWNTSPIATKAQTLNNFAHTSPSTKPLDIPKMCTLEEIESDLLKNVIKRPMRVEELEANLLNESSTSRSLPNKPSVVRDLNLSFDAVTSSQQIPNMGWNPLTAGIGANISEIIPNGKVQTQGNVSFNESTSKDRTPMKVIREKTPEKFEKEHKISQEEFVRRGENWRAPTHPMLARELQIGNQRLFAQQLTSQSPVSIINTASPLIPHQIPKHILMSPNSPFGSPFSPQYLRTQMIPFSSYGNQVRNMSPFPVPRLPNRNVCFVPLNRFPPHPLLHQQHQQALQQQHRNFQQKHHQHTHSSSHSNYQQVAGRNRSENGDAYSGFMTQREKDWLIKIQLMQLESENPYVEDYYYVTKMSRKIAESRNKSNQKEGKTSQTTALVLPERANKTVNENTNNYVPRQFEGSLGKISVCNVHCPRKMLDVNKKEMTQDPERPSTPSARYELKKFRQLLLEIEQMYVLMLNIDDEDKRINALPEEAKKDRLQHRKELCEKLFNGIMDSTHEHINLKMANIRKGCSLIFRSLLLFTEPKHKAIITGELLDINNFSFVVTQKDQTMYGLDYGQILIDCIKSINNCDFAYLLHIANSLNDAATVAKYQCGEEIIETILAQSLLFEKTEEEETKWRKFVNHVHEEVEDIARLRKLCSEHLSKLSS